MFDPITEELISGTPDLKNLKSSELVELLTSASVEIATSRLIAENLDILPENLRSVRLKMGRLADVFEAQVALDVNPDRFRSMAFISGSARQVVNRIDGILSPEDRLSQLDEDCIGADISSALLFLISERFSDATEAGRNIRASGEENPLRRLLILTVGRLARGQFQDIANTALETVEADSEEINSLATDLLYRELLQSIVLFARFSVGDGDSFLLEEAYLKIERVKSLAGSQASSLDDLFEVTLVARTTFPGPHQLASLLRVATEVIAANLLVNTPTPQGVEPEIWRDWLIREAKRWPLIWENHKAAIATNFLDVGSSMIMTTPTGTGKSTLSALKIAATLASGKTVLYLAPTHALVSQVEFDLNERLSELAIAESVDELTLDEAVERLPDIAVMTPEKCFALLTFTPELFGKVGLLVFDEFHLMGAALDNSHPSGVRADRRSIDAMLCFLTFAAINKKADYLLLSAMISNGEEIGQWLKGITNGPVVAFDYEWKPTRQLRGCLVYSDTDLRNQTRGLNTVGLKEPQATPYGLFALDSNWLPRATSSSALKPLSEVPLPLAIGGGKSGGQKWLTSNRNGVAAEFAIKLAKHGLKVLVFCETIIMVGSTANKINSQFESFEAKLTADQSVWRETAIDEVGDESAIYDAGSKMAAVHHGELLPYERRLVEGLFRSPDSGVNVLVATSTLAQGLNLPCDAVILAGTDRLDPETEKRKIMQEHEILNALGRAGRAGHSSTGLSIVIPGKPIPCNMDNYVPRQHEVASIVLSSQDRCVPLIDPLCTLLDEIEIEANGRPEAQYLARKLSVALKPGEDGITPFEALTKNSFGFYAKRTQDNANADAWLIGRSAQLAIILADDEADNPATWQQTLAAKTGASLNFIHQLEKKLPEAPWTSSNALDWTLWILEQFDPKNNDFDAFFRPESLERILARSYKKKTGLEAKREVAIAGIKAILVDWFSGKPLLAVEDTIAKFVAANEGNVPQPTKADKKGKFARRFSIRFASEISFVMSTFAQLVKEVELATGTDLPPLPGLLPQLVRFGFPTPYHFALSLELETSARVEVNRRYDELAKHLVHDGNDDWDVIRSKVSGAYSVSFFTEFSEEEFDELMATIKKDTNPE